MNFAAYWGLDVQLMWDLGLVEKLSSKMGLDNNDLSFSVYAREALLKQWNFGGDCRTQPPYLELAGPISIVETVKEGEGNLRTYNFTITNTGEQDLTWEAKLVNPWAILTIDGNASLPAPCQRRKATRYTWR